jgi:Uma2 family endonuclease
VRPSETAPNGTERLPAGRSIVLYGISWDQYEKIREALDASPGVRMTYREGVLEIMSPSSEHERDKKTIGRLLEAWADFTGTDLEGYGSTTFRKRAKARGLEPDECYYVGEFQRERPDIAIEVDITSSALDKLDVYAGLAVPEVWSWRSGALVVYRLVEERYEEAARSSLLPDLDLDLLAGFVGRGRQSQAVRAYREALAGARKT